MTLSKSLLLIVTLIFSISLFAHTDTTEARDTTLVKEIYKGKTGYNLAPFPEFMIDPFIGVYFGINFTLFDYGDGSRYPNYNRTINLNAAYGTKGKTALGLKFINYGRFIFYAKAGYTKATLYPFYGYNGYQTLYNAAYHNPEKKEYITSPFYNYEQELTRLDTYIQDTIKGTFINWQIGFDIGYYSTRRVGFSKLNKGVDDKMKLPDTLTLYDRYVDWGIIDAKDKAGGWANSVRVAIIYDTRDRITNPMTGFWTDATLRYSPSLFGNTFSAIQLSLVHRHYITLIKKYLSFAYRLRYDATFGEMPFYARPVLADGIEGFGGTPTLWGIHQNRILADQFAMGNFELRAKVFRLRFLNQNWYLALLPLFHTGVIIKPLKMDLSALTAAEREHFFNESYKGWYSSYGFGIKIVMNENTVIGFDWAHAINRQSGGDAIYVGFEYTF